MTKKKSTIPTKNILDQSNLEITTIPKEVFDYSNLEKLDLSYNQLEELENEIGALSNLTHLDLSNNKLQELPRAFEELQALEVLNLSNNQLTSFPLILTELPRLKVLKLKGNNLSKLPIQIEELKTLEILDLGFNPLTDLPFILAELKRLRVLDCTSNQFAAFPEVLLLMEQLQEVERLDLNFRLKLPTERLILLFKGLRHLKKQKASLATKKAAFDILFTGTYAGKRANVLPLLLVNYVAFSHLVRTYIVNTYHGELTEESRVAVLGKTEWVDLEFLDASMEFSRTVTDQTTHVVLGRQVNKQMLTSLAEHLCFISEKEWLAFLSPKQPANWLIEHKGNILDLLMSGQNDNIALALQLAKDNELLDEMLTELLMAYTWIQPKDTNLRNDLKALFYRRIPNFEQITLPSASFQFYTPSKSEHIIFQSIKNITGQTPSWDGLKIAHYLYNHHQAAYTYILEYSSLEEETEWIAQFVTKESISLGALPKLKKLPKAIVAFPDLQKLDLKGCSFRTFPNIELLAELPNLEEIDLRKNPISFIPRSLFGRLSKYRILLSK